MSAEPQYLLFMATVLAWLWASPSLDFMLGILAVLFFCTAVFLVLIAVFEARKWRHEE